MTIIAVTKSANVLKNLLSILSPYSVV
jgi:hypothetical protein